MVLSVNSADDEPTFEKAIAAAVALLMSVWQLLFYVSLPM